MLHVITEIGKSGYNEREKRHFPSINNRDSSSTPNLRGRKYIPHGYGDDYEFVPHSLYTEPEYTDCGPDWKSRLRYIPPPQNPDYPAAENWPTPWKSQRPFPWMSLKTNKEWTLHPEGYDSTLRCRFGGSHMATAQSSKEMTSSMMLGKCRRVISMRNNILQASPGDKSYQAVEYSPQFHRMGSTLPVVNFGGSGEVKPDTFLPLLSLRPIPRETFSLRERQRRKDEEVGNVYMLETWRPATPLVAPPHVRDAKRPQQTTDGLTREDNE